MTHLDPVTIVLMGISALLVILAFWVGIREETS